MRSYIYTYTYVYMPYIVHRHTINMYMVNMYLYICMSTRFSVVDAAKNPTSEEDAAERMRASPDGLLHEDNYRSTSVPGRARAKTP